MGNAKVVAIMPIKTNNERFPGKNTKLLGNKPLLQYQLEELKKANIEEIFVYCSDEKISEYLIQGTTFLKRPLELDLPTSNFNQIFDAFMKEIYADVYVYAHATAPFISASIIKDCIDKVVNKEYDSAFCATKIQDFLWKDGEPLNFDASNLPRSQDLDIIYRETSGVYVFSKEAYIKNHRRVGENPYIREVTFKEAIDINYPSDFKLAEILLTTDL